MMKSLVALVSALVLVSFSFQASAQGSYPRDITLSWDWPTLYVDTTLIQPGDLRGGDVICFRNNDLAVTVFDVPVAITVALGSRESVTLVGLIPQPGTYHCFVTAVTVDGISSDLSNEATRKFTGKPLPPQTFTSP